MWLVVSGFLKVWISVVQQMLTGSEFHMARLAFVKLVDAG